MLTATMLIRKPVQFIISNHKGEGEGQKEKGWEKNWQRGTKQRKWGKKQRTERKERGWEKRAKSEDRQTPARDSLIE